MNKEELKTQKDEIARKVKKLGPVKITMLIVLLAVLVLSYVFYDYIFGTNSVFIGDFGSDFLNALMALVPKIIKSLQIIAAFSIVTTIILVIISRVFHKTQRSYTVGRLICNLLKWVVTVIVVIMVLSAWGVDATALITGAGVITLVVGLGMNSLIADVVAGLFIVFENEFNLGDIITIDGFRGEVVEMGIRTTKLKAAGNVKIFNNSDIKAVLNQTVEPSVAKTLIDIEYDARLPEVEKLIREKVGELEIEGAVEPVSYDGVSALGASGVTLQFTTKCAEGDIFAVNRRLNAAVKNMFDENGINIPYDHLVVELQK